MYEGGVSSLLVLEGSADVRLGIVGNGISKASNSSWGDARCFE